MLFRIKKPKEVSLSSEQISALMQRDDLREVLAHALYPEYVSWEDFRHKKIPSDVTAEEAWQLLMLARHTPLRDKTVIKNEDGQHFTWIHDFPWFSKFYHELDMKIGGNLVSTRLGDVSDATKQRYVVRGIMEEAIASSQLEGAHVTRKVAKRMLTEGRSPRTKDEKMIVNNYRMIKAIEEKYKNETLSQGTLLEFHTTLTNETMDHAEEVGRFRTDSDGIVVGESTRDIEYHIPPKEDFMRSELERLIAYANDEISENSFVHPVAKATLLHFWFGYLHPFTDGNGRVARALFYWYLLRKGYWAISWIPLSQIIKRAPTQYGMAFVYTEQDNNDATYFLDYSLRKLRIALEEFEGYIRESEQESAIIMNRLRKDYNVNERQIQLLHYFLEHRDGHVTFRSHMEVHRISRLTAMKDFRRLMEYAFVSAQKTGREVHYYAGPKIATLVESIKN